MDKIEQTQMENINKAALAMADTIEAGKWVLLWSGHATLQLKKCIQGLVDLLVSTMIELPLTFFTKYCWWYECHQFYFSKELKDTAMKL